MIDFEPLHGLIPPFTVIEFELFVIILLLGGIFVLMLNEYIDKNR